jgi:hypothetical protein
MAVSCVFTFKTVTYGYIPSYSCVAERIPGIHILFQEKWNATESVLLGRWVED